MPCIGLVVALVSAMPILTFLQAGGFYQFSGVIGLQRSYQLGSTLISGLAHLHTLFDA